MRKPMRTLFLLGSALLVLALLMPLSAQETRGTITGTVTDPSGAVVPGVTVTVTNKDTAIEMRTETGEAGVYLVRELPPGRYSVAFESQGFSRKEVPDAILLVGRNLRVDVTMEVGQLAETVVVSESATLIDTTSTMIAHNVTSEEIDLLPKGRSFQGISVLSPSVNTGQIEGGFQVNGASAAENNYYIDGVSTTSLVDGRARQNATFEYVQEVQVKTGAIEAEYGGALGGVVSAVTKSGGNEFHGEVHYYFYAARIGASPVERLQLEPTDQTTFAFVQDDKQKNDNHEVGGTLSGPIVKNKLFFLTSASPRWQRRTNDYLFSNGTEPGSMSREYHAMNWFNKVSFDPISSVRMNFTWLYTPSYLTGSLYSYNGMQPNVSTNSLANAQGSSTRGYNQPEQSYTGQIDWTPTATSLLSVKGGRYYLNYKEVGIPYTSSFWYQSSSSVGIEGVPPELQQPVGYASPSAAQIQYDVTTRTYVQADFSQFANFAGQHNFKAGIGTQKNVNNVYDSWYGPLGRARIYWDSAFRTPEGRGQYGYYLVEDGRTNGSTGAHLTHLYFQDQWRIHPRLTLSLGLRMEKETIPSFRPDIQEYAFQFGFGDKLAPRLGASFDVFGNGKMKIYGAWGRYFDWTKYELARGTFGGDIWHIYYRTLDDPNVDQLNLNNMPGQNLWTGEYRDLRIPGFDLLDPGVKPMSSENMNFGAEYEIKPNLLFAGRYVRNRLVRTIEDLGALDAEGNEVYAYGNPGEGNFTVFPASGATCVVQVGEACGFPMPKAERTYDAMELSLTRRFSSGWLASASYVYSKLWGNYAGLQSTDEIRPATTGSGFGPAQNFAAELFRPGGNANRYFDLDEIMYDAHGNIGVFGRLPTDRPHVFKFFGSKQFKFGTEVGGFFRVMSGTPMSTQVWTVNQIPVYAEGRGDMGRTPVFSQTDLMIAHTVSLGEVKKLRFEFNFDNLFNQKTSMFLWDRYNRGEQRPDSSGIDLHDTDLSQGFDWQNMVANTPDGLDAGFGAVDPRYGQDAIFNPGFQGRFLVKFIF